MNFGLLVQVILAISITIILLVIGFLVYNYEMVKAIRDSGKVQKSVQVFSGIKDLAFTTNETYNTINPNHSLYLPIDGSINQPGGNSYSYNFWLYIDNSQDETYKLFPLGNPENIRDNGNRPGGYQTDSGFDDYLTDTGDKFDEDRKPIILFMKGSKKPYVYQNLCIKPPQDIKLKADVFIKNPLIKLERAGDVLTVEFNMSTSADPIKERARDTCNDDRTDWEYMNSYKIGLKNLSKRPNLQGHWFMVTIVLKDNYPVDPYPTRNKIRCSIYVNGTMELDKYIEGSFNDDSQNSVIRPNNGNLYINPDIMVNNFPAKNKTVLNNEKINKVVDKDKHSRRLMMADLSYYNYELSSSDILGIFNNGFTKKWAPIYGSQNQELVDKNLFDAKSYKTAERQLNEINKF